MIIFKVKELTKTDVICEVVVGGELSNRKSMFFPDKELHIEFLSEQDKKDLLFGIEQDLDFVALSFVSNAQNVKDAKEFLKANGGEHIDVIAKIDRKSVV